MFRRLKREFCLIGDNLSAVIAASFFTAFGGVVLWVSGGSERYFMKQAASSHGCAVPLASVFVLWLAVYALCGFVMALTWMHSCVFMKKQGICACMLAGFGYLMTLVWYALFFCTRLTLFPALLLILSFIAFAAIFVITRRTFFVISAAIILIEFAQLYFIYFSLTLFL